jgi:hypothetical protein
MKDLINDKIRKEYHAVPGESDYIANYSKTLKGIIDEIPASEQKKYEAMAEEWNRGKMAEEVRRR